MVDHHDTLVRPATLLGTRASPFIDQCPSPGMKPVSVTGLIFILRASLPVFNIGDQSCRLRLMKLLLADLRAFSRATQAGLPRSTRSML